MTEHADEQVMADIAATTLANLAATQRMISTLVRQFMLLANHADRAGDEPKRERLLVSLAAACVLRADSAEAVRDLAATLPLRGLEYGDD
jgi:hypothetical protein